MSEPHLLYAGDVIRNVHKTDPTKTVIRLVTRVTKQHVFVIPLVLTGQDTSTPSKLKFKHIKTIELLHRRKYHGVALQQGLYPNRKVRVHYTNGLVVDGTVTELNPEQDAVTLAVDDVLGAGAIPTTPVERTDPYQVPADIEFVDRRLVYPNEETHVAPDTWANLDSTSLLNFIYSNFSKYALEPTDVATPELDAIQPELEDVRTESALLQVAALGSPPASESPPLLPSPSEEHRTDTPESDDTLFGDDAVAPLKGGGSEATTEGGTDDEGKEKKELTIQTQEVEAEPQEEEEAPPTIFKYQQLVMNYMQIHAPYRGLLLYHGLGSGKTCSAIAIVEGIRHTMRQQGTMSTLRKIYVMTPAALSFNFQSQLVECRKLIHPILDKIDESTVIKSVSKRYYSVHYNGLQRLNILKVLGIHPSNDGESIAETLEDAFNDCVVIIDEVHNFIRTVMNNMAQNQLQKPLALIYNALLRAQNCKIIALSGTPIINDVFEFALLFNLLRGLVKVYTFPVINDVVMETIQKALGASSRVDAYEYASGKLHVSFLPQQFFHAADGVVRYSVKIPEITELDSIVKSCQAVGVRLGTHETHEYPLFPATADEFNNVFLDDANTFQNRQLFLDRVVGLVSYYKGESETLMPRKQHEPPTLVPFTSTLLANYKRLRLQEINSSKKAGRARDRQRERDDVRSDPSQYRVFSRQACNFAKVYTRPTPTKTDTAELTKILHDFGSDATLSEYSPKVAHIIQRVQAATGKVLIYSEFRQNGGIELIQQALVTRGYTSLEADLPTTPASRYILYTGAEDSKKRQHDLRVFNNAENDDGGLVKVILITAAGAEGITLKEVVEVHILEPYWNTIRLDQVIGRAVRINSHKNVNTLVHVYTYLITYSDEQKQEILHEADSDIAVYDVVDTQLLTTDQYVDMIARKKRVIADVFLAAIKEAAIDCTLNAAENANVHKCVSYGIHIPDVRARRYTTDIEDDLGRAKTYPITPTEMYVIQWNGVRYVLDPNSRLVYDYDSCNRNNEEYTQATDRTDPPYTRAPIEVGTLAIAQDNAPQVMLYADVYERYRATYRIGA